MAHLTTFQKRRQRVRTALRQRAAGRPRLSVHRSGRHIYAQLIDDAAGATLASASTLDKDVRGKTGATTAAAADVGKRLAAAAKKAGVTQVVRSEEHTSELQSLMRISYAVFCLKKKKKRHTTRRYVTKDSNTNTKS